MRNGAIYSLFVLILFHLSPSSAAAQAGKEIKICVDPRIELLSVVQLLANYKVLTRFDSKYKKDVLAYFEKYKEHEAVSLFKDLDGDGFNFDRPIGLLLRLSDPPKLDTLLPVPVYYYKGYGGIERINNFISSLRRFYIETNFENFLTQHEEFYKSIEQSVKDTCQKTQ